MRVRPKRLALSFAIALLGVALLAIPALSQQGKAPIAYSIEFSGTVDPATEGWIDKALEEAEEADARVAIIRLDTPGGLDTSMRSIIKDIIAAPMPVVVYVSPNGARAASAGVYITEAADVAAMAPQTNIGSATPISATGGDIPETLGRKVRNDAAAFVRALAEAHGRNPELAEQMVRKATNVTASEAKQAGLIDIVAADQNDLLRQLNGFEVKGPKAQTLDTTGVTIDERDMPLQYDLLELLVNPTIAFLLLAVGFLGIAIEVFSPGAIAPGALGAVSLILGLYGTSQLPVTIAGIALLILAAGLLIAEAHLPTHGILGGAGVVSLIAGGLLLFDTDTSAVGISVPVVIFTGLLLGGFFAFMVERVVAARREPVRTGWEEMVGAEGEVRSTLAPIGQIFAKGALWRATPVDGEGPIDIGNRVRVVAVEGLTLHVEPAGTPVKSNQKGS